jgi:hypothetical protein
MTSQEKLVLGRVREAGQFGLHLQDSTFDLLVFKKAARSLERQGVIQMRSDLCWVLVA